MTNNQNNEKQDRKANGVKKLNMKSIEVSLPPKVLDLLNKLAEQRCMTRNQLIRFMIWEWLEENVQSMIKEELVYPILIPKD